MFKPATRSKIAAAITLAIAGATFAAHASAAAISWNNTGGTGDGATWDIATNQNWSNAGVPAVYNDGDTVTFNDTNNTNFTATMATSLAPGSLTENAITGTYTINIGSANTLTVNGAFTVGGIDPVNAAQNAKLVMTGGNLIINTANNFFAGSNSSGTAGLTATLDLSGVSNFTSTTGEFNLGGRQANTTGNRGNGNVTLASVSNLITTTTVNVGAGSNSNAGASNFLRLGAGTNTINADAFFVGTHKSTGTINFAGSTGSLIIRNKAGTGRANMTIGSHQSSGTLAAKGSLNFVGHTIDVLAGTVIVGQITSATGSATVASSISFDAGTFDVTSLTLGNKTGSALGITTSTLTQGGGTLIVNSAGGGGFVLGNNGSSGAGSADGIYNLNGGLATINSNITRGTATGNATVNLSGGTLDLTGNNIGAASPLAVTLNTNTGTLKNVNLINGTGGITKSTAGTLTLAGTDNYTGPTNVSLGSLLVDGGLTASAVSVTGTGLLGGSGVITNTVSIASSATLSPGDSINLLTVGSTTLAGLLEIQANDLDPNVVDRLKVFGTFDISAPTSTVDFSVTGTLSNPAYVFAQYTSLTGTFNSVTNLPAGYAIDYNYLGNNQIALVQSGGTVPEPTSLALLALASPLLLKRRRK